MKNNIDHILLSKYNISGPRYTSYPTALQFADQFSAEDYRRSAELSNQALKAKPLSLYIHIPFCESLCYYCGCHKVITQNRDKVRDYLDSLHREIQLQSKLFDSCREVKQIHLGGGTPTYLSTAEIKQLVVHIQKHFTLSVLSECEMGIEIDPRTSCESDIRQLARMGFNRMSFGIQDFDPQVQAAINRIQSKDQTLKLLATARQSGVESLSVDLIYGLPKQTVHGFADTLSTIVETRPDRIALYNYAHMPQRIKSQKLIKQDDLPSPEHKLELLCLSIETLTEAGYCHIGMDHFALPDDPLSRSLEHGGLHRNFQGYSTHGDCDIIGMGVSAISKIGDSFGQNIKSLTRYQEYINCGQLAIERGYVLSQDDQLRAAIIQAIMCSATVDFNVLTQTFGMDFDVYFKHELEQLMPMVDGGLVVLTDQSIRVTEKGRLLLRNIAMTFDAYLPTNQSADNGIGFSKVL